MIRAIARTTSTLMIGGLTSGHGFAPNTTVYQVRLECHGNDYAARV